MAAIQLKYPPAGKTVQIKEYMSRMDPGASPVEKWANGPGGTVTRIWECLWSERHSAMYGLLGYSEREKGLADKFVIKRYLPHSYLPTGRSRPLYATEVSSMVGKGGPEDGVTHGANDVSVYDTAFLTTTYADLPYTLLPDDQMVKNSDGNPDETRMGRYVAFAVKTAGAYLPLPNGFLIFNEGGTKNDGKEIPGGGAGFIEPTGEFSIKWFQVPEKCVPSVLVNPDLQSVSTLGTYDTTVGKVNDAAFCGLGAGKVLCLPADFGEPKKSVVGTLYYDILFRFRYDPNGFNKAMSVADGRYVTVARKGDNTKGVYEAGTLTNLFKSQGG